VWVGFGFLAAWLDLREVTVGEVRPLDALVAAMLLFSGPIGLLAQQMLRGNKRV